MNKMTLLGMEWFEVDSRMIWHLKRYMVTFLTLLCTVAHADEGMWLLDALPQLSLERMHQYGLALSPEQISTLKEAAVLITSGTASFVSPEGLLLTNHHVAFGAIQSLSSLESDYLQDGFWAKAREEELPTSYTVDIIVGMRDITDEVHSELRASMSPEERTRSIRSRILDVEEAEPDTGGYMHKVVEMYEGNRHYLFRFRRLSDIRLVYAPPSAIGNFGGEVDNWMWPRHSGDFALMRAYVGPDGRPAPYSKENIPYHPRVFLPFSSQGYRDGSFAMILGFPGKTYRYQEASAVRLAIEETLPTTADLYSTRIAVIDHQTKSNRSSAIRYASRLRRLSNTYKKYLGIIAAAQRSDLLRIKQHEEQEFHAYVEGSPTLRQRADSLLEILHGASEELRGFNKKNLLFSSIGAGVELIPVANRFISYANSFSKDSLGNTIEPTEPQRDALRRFLESAFKDLDVGIDSDILTALLLKSFQLGLEQLPAVSLEAAQGDTGAQRNEKVRAFIGNLYHSTRLTSPSGCDELLAGTKEEILSDPFVQFAQRFAAERGQVETAVSQVNARLAEYRSRFVDAWLGWKINGPRYPDANRTLRFTYGQVKSLSPRDAVHYSSITTLTGVMEKEAKEPPFDIPARLKQLWQTKDFGGYADPSLHDVPVAFISNLDITGGNSGSPVINGKGELIGCAFDSNWEGVAGDYRYEEEYDRTISVDARYILFILDKFSGANNILRELVIH